MEKFQFQNALDEVFGASSAPTNISTTMPWSLAKDEANKPRLASVMYNLLETVRICTTLLLPFMPDSCEKIFAQIGANADVENPGRRRSLGQAPATVTVH